MGCWTAKRNQSWKWQGFVVLKELSRVLMRNGYADGHDIKKIFDDQQKRENVL